MSAAEIAAIVAAARAEQHSWGKMTAKDAGLRPLVISKIKRGRA